MSQLGQQHACRAPSRHGESTPNFCRTDAMSCRGSSCQALPNLLAQKLASLIARSPALRGMPSSGPAEARRHDDLAPAVGLLLQESRSLSRRHSDGPVAETAEPFGDVGQPDGFANSL
jgi:hypothetical protein